jgi:hypothetical protein
LVAQLERPGIAKVFSIYAETRRDLRPLQADIAAWPVPSLALLRGTIPGAAVFQPAPNTRQVRMEDQFDAVLYLGPLGSMTMSHLTPALCSDSAYLQMRRSRMALVPPPAGAPVGSLAERLDDECASPKGNMPSSDSAPDITELVRQTIVDAAQGKVDPSRFAPESQERLAGFLKQAGPQFLAPAGALRSLTLLSDTSENGRRTRRYRSVFASGENVVWTVGLSVEGRIVSLDPRPD